MKRWPAVSVPVPQILSWERVFGSRWCHWQVPCNYLKVEFGLLTWPKPKLGQICEHEPSFIEKLTLVEDSSPESVFYLYLFSSAWCLALLFASFAISLSNKRHLIGVLIKHLTLLCTQVNIVSVLSPHPPWHGCFYRKPTLQTLNKESSVPRLTSFLFIL